MALNILNTDVGSLQLAIGSERFFQPKKLSLIVLSRQILVVLQKLVKEFLLTLNLVDIHVMQVDVRTTKKLALVARDTVSFFSECLRSLIFSTSSVCSKMLLLSC